MQIQSVRRGASGESPGDAVVSGADGLAIDLHDGMGRAGVWQEVRSVEHGYGLWIWLAHLMDGQLEVAGT